MKKIIHKNRALIILVILFVFIWIFSIIFNNKIENEIAENRYITIGKVYEISKGGPNNTSLHYKSMYNGKVYHYQIHIKSSRKSKTYIGRYFEVHLSTKNPENSHIYLNKEILDRKKIENLEL